MGDTLLTLGNPVAKEERSLPLYDSPPVIETVLGFQFLPIDRFSLLHLGLFWSSVKQDYPKFQIKPPLNPVVEQFENLKVPTQVLGLGLAKEPEVRCWLIDQHENHLVQIQKDRFHFNWKKVTGFDIYPQYDTCRPRFNREWERFSQFLVVEKLAPAQVTQCEVTYVNHLEMGRGWNSYSELHKVFTGLASMSDRKLLREPEHLSLNYVYVIPGKKGRLHIDVQPGIRREDGTQIIQLQMTARGKPASNQLDDLLGWLDLGHEWIVNGFTDFTTQYMHTIWGRKL